MRLARSLTKPWQQALPLLPRKEPVGMAGGPRAQSTGQPVREQQITHLGLQEERGMEGFFTV